jgi:hypothetical protein
VSLPQSKRHHLLSLTRKEKQRLKLRVKKWNGLVRLFVHPLFEKWHWSAEQYPECPNYGRLIKIETGLSRIVSLSPEKTPPVIIMEEHIFGRRLDEWLARTQTRPRVPVYRVMTEQDDPKPFLPDRFEYYETEKAYGALVKVLRQIGVKKIIVAGMKFEAATWKTDWTNKSPWVGRCVGKVLSHLSKDKAGEFETEISFLVDSPYARGVYIEATSGGNKTSFVP